ncbi:hypothetical protein [Spirosoma litoris]
MQLLISDLKTERQWRSATGLEQKRFDKLLWLFEKAYWIYLANPLSNDRTIA